MAMNITHEPDAHRYVLSNGDEFLGEVEYQIQGSTLLLVRAEVPVEKRGQGLGIPLTREPSRPFAMRASIRSHPSVPTSRNT